MSNAEIMAQTLAEICAMEAPIWRRFELYIAKQRELGSPFVSASDALVARLREGAVGVDAPQVGDQMPDFLLPDGGGRLRSLSEFVANGPVIVSFNRGHWCPFCRIELAALAAAHDDFLELGAPILSLMPDRQAYVGRMPQRVRDRIVILSDLDAAYALSLGLVMWLDDDLSRLMQMGGIDLAATQGSDAALVPLPATFVVDRDGHIAARFVETEFRRRMEVDQIRAVLMQLRGAAHSWRQT